MVDIADANGADTYKMVSIYFNNLNQVTTDRPLTIVGVVLRDSSEIAALA